MRERSSPPSAPSRSPPSSSRLNIQFAHRAREKGLDLRIVPSKLAVVSDRVLLERILSNLLGNAIRYTDVGRVLVGCRRHGRDLRIIVADTGIGIAPEHHEAIFEEFYRVSDSQANARHSLGLGLNIARRLSDILGHPMGLHSVLGKGTSFFIDVPVGNVWHSGTGEPEISERIGGEFAGLCCLVLEDDKMLREALTAMLERWGLSVVTIDDFDNAGKGRRWPSRSSLTSSSQITACGAASRAPISWADQRGSRKALPCPRDDGRNRAGRRRAIKAQGFPLLIKPVSPPSLRVVMHNLLFEPELMGRFLES